jgi:hypothetical protein
LERQQQVTVQETRALLQDKEEHRLKLADEMVQELWVLNQELKSLMQWKQHHAHKVETYDELVAKLLLAEEELAAAQRISYGGGGGVVVPSPPPRKPATEVVLVVPEAATTTTTTTEVAVETPYKMTAQKVLAEESKPWVPEETLPEADATTTITTKVEDSSEAEDTKSNAKSENESEDVSEKKEETEQNYNSNNESVSDGPAVVLEDAKLEERGTTTEESLEAPPAASSPNESSSAVIVESEGAEEEQVVGNDEDAKHPGVVGAAVSLDDEADPNEGVVPSLETLDVEILMQLFGFFDPMDILNTAQISIVMYNRVDALFGLAEDGVTPPSQAKEDAAAAKKAAPAAAARQQQQQQQRQQQQQSAATARAQSAAASANIVAKPPATETKPAAVEGFGLFSMLQPARAAGLPVPAVASTAKPMPPLPAAAKGVTNKAGGSATGSQPLTGAVAKSLAAKLSAPELAAIISMTGKLSKMEQERIALKNEKEELEGKLQGTEAVKQFLIGKVRDVERNLKQFKENEVKVTQQISSDQEVIGFLDARVQVLEKEADSLQQAKVHAETELRNLKGSSGQKVTLLSDMLKYEREKLRESESEWKSTKKVLIKEVKSCRSQIVALQAERDGYREQNEMLKRAMLSSSSSSANSSNGGAGGGGRATSPRRGGGTNSPPRR